MLQAVHYSEASKAGMPIPSMHRKAAGDSSWPGFHPMRCLTCHGEVALHTVVHHAAPDGVLPALDRPVWQLNTSKAAMAELRAKEARNAELLRLDALERHTCATLE